MTATPNQDHQQALRSFQEDLQKQWAEHPGLWVAYKGHKQIGMALRKHELYQQCFQLGLQREEFVIFCIEPQQTEIDLGCVVLD